MRLEHPAKTSVVKPIRDFIHHLSLYFGSRDDKMMIILPPKLYDYAWRELVDGYRNHIVVESEDIPPKRVSFYTLGFEVVLMPVRGPDET